MTSLLVHLDTIQIKFEGHGYGQSSQKEKGDANMNHGVGRKDFRSSFSKFCSIGHFFLRVVWAGA